MVEAMRHHGSARTAARPHNRPASRKLKYPVATGEDGIKALEQPEFGPRRGNSLATSDSDSAKSRR